LTKPLILLRNFYFSEVLQSYVFSTILNTIDQKKYWSNLIKYIKNIL